MKTILSAIIAIFLMASISTAGIGIVRDGVWYVDKGGNSYDPNQTAIYDFGVSNDKPVFVPLPKQVTCPMIPYFFKQMVWICEPFHPANCYKNITNYVIDDFGYIVFCNGNNPVRLDKYEIIGESRVK